MKGKFLGICIVIATIILAGTVVFYTYMNRYHPVVMDGQMFTFDSFTATYYSISQGKINQIHGWKEESKSK